MTAITKHTDASAHPIHQVRWDTHGHSGRSGYPNSIRIPIPNLYPRRLMMHISLNFFAVCAFVFFYFWYCDNMLHMAAFQLSAI